MNVALSDMDEEFLTAMSKIDDEETRNIIIGYLKHIQKEARKQ